MSGRAQDGPGVAVLGLGFMGRTHLAAYRAAARQGHPNRLVAVCDQDPERLAGKPAARGNLEAEAGDEPLFDVTLLALAAHRGANAALVDLKPKTRRVAVRTFV